MFGSGNQLKGGVNDMAMAKMGMGSDKDTQMSPHKSGMAGGGHLYLQTNETRNCVVHYRRAADGTLTEAERVSTGGAGSGEFKPISGQESAPNAFEGAGSVILSPDRRFLFVTNGGNNSVSSFAVAEDGGLTLLDCEPTGNPVMGKSGTAKSLAFAASKGILYVLHSFGPDHLRLMSGRGRTGLSLLRDVASLPRATCCGRDLAAGREQRICVTSETIANRPVIAAASPRCNITWSVAGWQLLAAATRCNRCGGAGQG
jgi:hypothetical protein